MSQSKPPVEAYLKWVKDEALKIKSDGCSKVLDINLPCCYEHDLGYYYGRDPRDSYKLSLMGKPDFWSLAAKISRSEVDKRFRECNLKADPHWFDWDAWGRWVGVRVGGFFAWRDHRKERS